MGVPARVAAHGVRFVGSFGFPGGSFGSSGLPWAPLGWSLGTPARLAAQGACFGGVLGVLWGDPWASPHVWLHGVCVL